MALHNDRGSLIGDEYSIEAFARHGLDLVKDFTAAVDGVQYDTIVVTGISGTIWGARVAEYLGRNLMIVRKPSDVHHSDFDAEGYLGKRWIFADDFISAGGTASRVCRYMAERHPQAEFMGIYEYAIYGDGIWSPLSWYLETDLNDMFPGYARVAKALREIHNGDSVRPLSEEERTEIQDAAGKFKHLGYVENAPTFSDSAKNCIPQRIMIGTEE